jgi:hypothetical protein
MISNQIRRNERERERERERGVGSLGFYVWITISQFLKLGFIIFL